MKKLIILLLFALLSTQTFADITTIDGYTITKKDGCTFIIDKNDVQRGYICKHNPDNQVKLNSGECKTLTNKQGVESKICKH
jgi:hypothetical protein